MQAEAQRLCGWCRRVQVRVGYCSTRCRVAAWRERNRDDRVTGAGGRYALERVTPSMAIADETVAALYVRADGPYVEMPHVDAWPLARDATKYDGPHPVIAHPPCAPWGAYRTIAPTMQRADLAVRAVDQVRWFGGVLEHPAKSHLWVARDLPAPGEPPDQWGGWSMLIRQSWWGHAAPKPTWLYIVGKAREALPALPAPVPDPGGRVLDMARADRELTPPALALWLVLLARGASPRRRRNATWLPSPVTLAPRPRNDLEDVTRLDGSAERNLVTVMAAGVTRAARVTEDGQPSTLEGGRR
jgi:hypothetical protein